ncbi:FAD-binding oxidoreductase [Mesorhizobium sp. BAC0120]|uniref:NAD(P)/FAD-dependent oxidoreductase n=1 Tax=Mesorhizobium sp. BAC0120 TaxID=3090670 RepID=UPI00298CA33B|nr:FAD-binding oxidoreductase [Mesorhizobium sp. BAC0120]MDW6021138.1 FAD-binding oxidoreductase [Mesorhizobium sp. BAC0120]
MADVIVIGGGIHGCSAAFHLARRGVSVQLIEKDTIGRHASGVNAGGVRQIFRALPEIPLSIAAMRLWERIEDLLDDDCGFVAQGHLFVAENDAELEQLKARRDTIVAAGFDHEELIGASELRGLVPALAGHCVGALISRRDGAALPFHTVQAFRRQMRRLGVGVAEETRVTALRRTSSVWAVETAQGDRFEAPVVVNTAGAWGAAVAAQVGERVEMQAVAPMLMISERVAPFLSQVISAAVAPLSFKQFANGTVLIGGGYEGRAHPDVNRTDLDFRKLSRNAKTVYDLFPVMRGARIIRAWAGIEGRMSDGIPVIGPSQAETGLFHAFGFSAHGFQLGPIVGSIVADLIIDGTTELPIDAFSIRRFNASEAGSRPGYSAGI